MGDTAVIDIFGGEEELDISDIDLLALFKVE